MPHHDDRGRFTFGSDGGSDAPIVPIARKPRDERPGPRGKQPNIPDPPHKPGQPQPKEPKPGLSGKEGSKDVPSWAQGEKPFVGENGDAFAKRVLDQKYGPGQYDVGPNSEFNKIKKFGDRNFD